MHPQNAPFIPLFFPPFCLPGLLDSSGVLHSDRRGIAPARAAKTPLDVDRLRRIS